MAKHAVIRTDKMFGTDDRVGIYSFVFYDSDEVADIDNGNIVKLEGLLEGERELYKAVAPAADSAMAELVVVASPELNYDSRLPSLDDFYNKAGVPSRGYTLHENQIFSVTKAALSGKEEPEVGDLVELDAGETKLKVVGSATAETTQVGKIAAIESAGRFTYYVIEIR